MRSPTKLAARTAMQRYAYDPIEQLVMIAQKPETSPQEKKEIACQLLPYMYPKLQSAEIQIEADVNIHAPNRELLMRKILENPELADAAQKLSLAASDMLLEAGVEEQEAA